MFLILLIIVSVLKFKFCKWTFTTNSKAEKRQPQLLRGHCIFLKHYFRSSLNTDSIDLERHDRHSKIYCNLLLCQPLLYIGTNKGCRKSHILKPAFRERLPSLGQHKDFKFLVNCSLAKDVIINSCPF